MEKITTYLKSMQLAYEVQPVNGKITRIIVPYSVPENDLRFNVIIDYSAQFVRFWTMILPHGKIRSKKKREALYQELLRANGDLAEVNYFLTEQGDIGVIGHEGVDVLTIDGFREEFRAIPQGIIYFLTVIAKKLKLTTDFLDKKELPFYT